MAYDLLIKGGTVIDPSQGLNGVRDIALADGKVASIAESISESEAIDVFDATGLIVAPGLLDLHMHVFQGASHYGVDPDMANLAKGVTTALDAGTAGAGTFPAFRKHVLEQADTQLYALLNISAMGMISRDIGELEDMRWANVGEAVAMGRANRDYILGLKARLSRPLAGDNDMEALRRAVEAADALGGFVMAHVGNSKTPLEELVAMLRPGDVVTHTFPGNISSDLHSHNIEGLVFDQVTTISKFMHLGMSLEDVIRLTTETTAKTMGMSDAHGTLKAGAVGGVAILRLDEGRFKITDAMGVSAEARRMLTHVRTVRAGRIYRPWMR